MSLPTQCAAISATYPVAATEPGAPSEVMYGDAREMPTSSTSASATAGVASDPPPGRGRQLRSVVPATRENAAVGRALPPPDVHADRSWWCGDHSGTLTRKMC